MYIKSEQAFFTWLKKNGQTESHFTDIKSVYDWITEDKKMKNVASIADMIRLMKKDKYFSERHHRKVRGAYKYYLEHIIA